MRLFLRIYRSTFVLKNVDRGSNLQLIYPPRGFRYSCTKEEGNAVFSASLIQRLSRRRAKNESAFQCSRGGRVCPGAGVKRRHIMTFEQQWEDIWMRGGANLLRILQPPLTFIMGFDHPVPGHRGRR